VRCVGRNQSFQSDTGPEEGESLRTLRGSDALSGDTRDGRSLVHSILLLHLAYRPN
jgi:hypothetical protein